MDFKSLGTGTTWNNPISALADTMIRDKLVNDILHGRNKSIQEPEATSTASPKNFERRTEHFTIPSTSDTGSGAGALALAAVGVAVLLGWALSKNAPASQPSSPVESSGPEKDQSHG